MKPERAPVAADTVLIVILKCFVALKAILIDTRATPPWFIRIILM